MRRYVIRRILLVIPTLLLVTLIVFAAIRLIPGDVVTLMVEDYFYADTMEEMRERLGLNKPVHEQYLTWLGDMLRGDFGESLWTKRSVGQELAHRMPVTLELAFLSLLITVGIGIPFGVLAAVRQDTITDYGPRGVALTFLAVPNFWLATLVIVLPSIWFGWIPRVDYVRFFDSPLGNLEILMVPVLINSVGRAAVIMRMSRAMVLEVLRQDYVRTAWSKGLTQRTILSRHVLKNAMIPTVTMVGIQIPGLIGGSVVIESIFGLPGMGRLLLEVITSRDYPMLQSLTLLFATITLLSNLIVDLVTTTLDPRIRYG